MHEFWKNILNSILSGLIFESNNQFHLVLIRIFVYLSIIGLFFIPYYCQLKILNQICFSIGIASLVLLIKLPLYILNKLIDKSNSNVNSKQNLNQSLLEEERPNLIPGNLWEKRFNYVDKTMNYEDALELYDNGFDFDAVAAFFSYMTTHKSIPKENRNLFSSFEISISKRKLPRRRTLNSLFNGNTSLLYIICSTILSFLMSFTASNSKCLAVWSFGPAIYSIISPPEVDPYSTTKGNFYCGLSRSLYLFFITSIEIILREISNRTPTYTYEYLNLTVNWLSIYLFVKPILRWLIYLMPLFILFFIGHPISILTWIFEWTGRYGFGLDGTPNLAYSIFQLIRSSIVVLISYYSMKISNHLLYSLMFTISIDTFLLQIPLSYSLPIRKQLIEYFISVLCLSSFTILGSYLGSLIDIQLVLVISAAYATFFEILIPYLNSYNRYIFFYYKFISLNSRIMNFLRMLIPYLISPMLISAIALNDTKMPTLLLSFLIVISMNRSLIDNPIFAVTLITFSFSINYELYGSPYGLIYLLSFWISTKLLSIIPILYFFSHRLKPKRPNEDFSIFEMLRDLMCRLILSDIKVLFAFWNIFPFFWSLLTGSPFADYFKNNEIFLLPSSPMPNSFWNVNNEQILDPKKVFGTSLTEHPVETPTYVSFSRELSRNLGKFIKSGYFGLVCSNDMFLFTNGSMFALVHIVGQEPNCTFFQVRGLEYANVTICHRNEISFVTRQTSEYFDNANIFEYALQSYSCGFQIKAHNIPLKMYSPSEFTIPGLFVGISKSSIKDWCCIAFVYILKQNSIILSEISTDMPFTSDSYMLTKYLNLFGLDCSALVCDLWSYFQSLLFNQKNDLNYNMLHTLFNEEIEHPNFNEKYMKAILYPAFRFAFLVLENVVTQPAPELSNINEIVPFIEGVNEDYDVCTLNSDEFTRQFELGSKSIFTMITKREQNGIKYYWMNLNLVDDQWNVMKLDRELVRYFWRSDATIQMFCACDDPERFNIQYHFTALRNLITQSANIPIGYPALVSPILPSYIVPSKYAIERIQGL